MENTLTAKDFLQQQLELRVSKNKRYSLRAFAQDLQVSPSFLCEILKGKKGLSVDKAKLMAVHLKLEAAEAEYFVDLACSEHSRSPAKREVAKSKIQSYRPVLAV